MKARRIYCPGETSRHLIRWLSEHAKAIKRSNINSLVMAANFTGVHSSVK